MTANKCSSAHVFLAETLSKLCSKQQGMTEMAVLLYTSAVTPSRAKGSSRVIHPALTIYQRLAVFRGACSNPLPAVRRSRCRILASTASVTPAE